MPRKVLVTGGAGFIGSHMVDRLINLGYEAVVLDNLSTGFRKNVNEKAIFIEGDVRNEVDVETAFECEPDIVFHIAGQASTIRSFNDPEEDLQVNVTGTINVVRQCLLHRVPRLLYASSMTAYGHPDSLPILEETLCKPISYYGITKFAAERYIHATAERNNLDFVFNVTSFRMFNVYGPRQSLSNPYQGVVTIFISNILNREPITIFGDGEQSRDFVHITDTVDAWINSIDNEKTFGEVFNIGTSTRVTVNSLVDVILKAFGRNRENYKVIYDRPRPGDQRHMQADISKAKKLIPWNPKVSFDKGMKETIHWARSQNEEVAS